MTGISTPLQEDRGLGEWWASQTRSEKAIKTLFVVGFATAIAAVVVGHSFGMDSTVAKALFGTSAGSLGLTLLVWMKSRCDKEKEEETRKPLSKRVVHSQRPETVRTQAESQRPPADDGGNLILNQFFAALAYVASAIQ